MDISPLAPRRLLRLSAQVLVAALLAAAIVALPGARPVSAVTPIYAGLITDDFWGHAKILDSFAAWSGQRVTFSGTFHNLAEDPGATDHKLESAWVAKSTPFANVEADGSARALASGQFDGQMRAFANSVRKWLDQGGGRSLIVAPFQEMNGSWTKWGCDAANFKAAYHRMRDIFAAVGIENETQVRWAFAPNGWTDPQCGSGIRDYFPGAGTVDLVGISAYNYGSKDSWNGFQYPDAVFGPWLNELRGFVPDLPYVIAQTGTPPEGDRDGWLRRMFSFLAEDPNAAGFVYFNVDKSAWGGNEWDWRVFVNGSGAAGMRDGMGSPMVAHQWPLKDWFKPGPLAKKPAASNPAPTGHVDRLSGSGRIDTAVAVSQAAFANGAPAVVIATAADYPDALAGAPLAAALGGPILLVTKDGLPGAVATELGRLGAKKAVILGGTGAVSETVATQLRQRGLVVDRVAGSSRFDTAAKVAARLGAREAYLVEGANPDPRRGWPDAVAVSSLAAARKAPILLATSGTVPAETLAALDAGKIAKVVVVGGQKALPDHVLQPVRDRVPVRRIAGDSRYTTSLLVAKEAAAAGMTASGALLTTGANWPDALSAGPAAAARGTFALLVPGSMDDAPQTRDWLAAQQPDALALVGGPSAVSQAVEWWAHDVTAR
jgi:putative cell wall-binding protein